MYRKFILWGLAGNAIGWMAAGAWAAQQGQSVLAGVYAAHSIILAVAYHYFDLEFKKAENKTTREE